MRFSRGKPTAAALHAHCRLGAGKHSGSAHSYGAVGPRLEGGFGLPGKADTLQTPRIACGVRPDQLSCPV